MPWLIVVAVASFVVVPLAFHLAGHTGAVLVAAALVAGVVIRLVVASRGGSK